MRLAWVLSLSGSIFLAGMAPAQQVISARAGLIHHADGRVLLNDKPLVHKITQFQEVRENQILRTERGRAEVLLTPGIFLRLGEESVIEMLSTQLSDARLRLLSGSAVVEADEVDKDVSVTVVVSQVEVRLPRAGLYRFDAPEGEPPQLRVFSGEAIVKAPAGEIRVRNRKEIDLAADFAIRKFDPEDTDSLDRWSKRRAQYLSMANLSAGRMAYRSGMSFTDSRWIWNPYFGLYTFLPHRDVCWSPYGYGFYSPRAVYYIYNPPRAPAVESAFAAPSYNANYGYTTRGTTSGGSSGVIAASPSAPASSAGGGASVRSGTETGGGGARR